LLKGGPGRIYLGILGALGSLGAFCFFAAAAARADCLTRSCSNGILLSFAKTRVSTGNARKYSTSIAISGEYIIPPASRLIFAVCRLPRTSSTVPHPKLVSTRMSNCNHISTNSSAPQNNAFSLGCHNLHTNHDVFLVALTKILFFR